jgi:serine beta-lactamase-like protein LACTB, mitochondrial
LRPFLVALSLLCPLSAAVDWCAPIRALAAAEAKKQSMPAISVAVVRDHQLACSIALGWADLEQRVPNNSKSLHRLASLSKPITAVFTMQLVEEGKLALGDSIRQWIPDLPEHLDRVTIRHLLAHQSGIREYADMGEVLSNRHYTTLEEASRNIFTASPLLFEPGSKTAYTTYGYTLLGAALERITGQSFRQIVESRFPGIVLDDSLHLMPGRVRPYRKSTAAAPWENAPAFDASNKYSGGGMLSTADTYASFLIQVRNLLRKETIAAMWTPQRLNDGSLVPYGTLGWATGTRGTDRYFTHGGLQPGTTTVMHWFPDLGVGSVILCNAEGPDLDALQERILAILLRHKRPK